MLRTVALRSANVLKDRQSRYTLQGGYGVRELRWRSLIPGLSVRATVSFLMPTKGHITCVLLAQRVATHARGAFFGRYVASIVNSRTYGLKHGTPQAPATSPP